MTDRPLVTLFGKADCHLCDEAETLLTSVARRQPLTLQKVDIQSSPELFSEFRYRIPVIQVSGGQTLEWPTTAERIRRAVQAAASASRAAP